MRAPPLPLEDRQDLAFFNLMVRALTTPPRLSNAPRVRASATPVAHVPSPFARLPAWLGAARTRAAHVSPAFATDPRALAAADEARERAVPHPYY